MKLYILAVLLILAVYQSFAQNNVYNIKIDVTEKKEAVKLIYYYQSVPN